MKSYYIPRNYKGEGRILYIFSTKAIIYTAVGVGIGLIFYFLFNLIGLTMIGIIIAGFLGLVGFCIATFKVPDMKNFELTKKTGGEKIDDVIKRWILFKKNNNKIYVYMNENITEDKEEQKNERSNS
ncbi:MAG: hypothetical protein ACLSD2_01285 [Clostridia bacterium]|jgi:hypothetical protein